MLRRLAALALTAAVAVTAPAVPASAATSGACRPGDAASPVCKVWTGTVDWVADGDTPRVYIDGSKKLVSVRILGIQAMEQHVYSTNPARRRGDCHALEATARAEQLIKEGGGKVRLTAMKASSQSNGRPLRSVAVKVNGQWRDVGLDLVRRGLALWLPFHDEWGWDQQYRRAAQLAAAEHRGLYATASCGAGPSQDSGLRLEVNGDPPGVDADNLNGEYFRLVNPSAKPVPVAGWWVRDSGLRRYTFAAGTVVPAGGDLFVHVGKGKDTAAHKHWGLTEPIFTNVDPAHHGYGDGGYLFDPQGDLRAWMIYPCVVRC